MSRGLILRAIPRAKVSFHLRFTPRTDVLTSATLRTAFKVSLTFQSHRARRSLPSRAEAQAHLGALDVRFNPREFFKPFRIPPSAPC